MNSLLECALGGFTNIRSEVRKGITHTMIRVQGELATISRSSFMADVYINRRTQEVSIARIDTGDERTLRRILAIISNFKF
jgi:hypothetical protein